MLTVYSGKGHPQEIKIPEHYDAIIAGRITRRQKAELDEFCWQNRITQSELVRGFVENVLELKQ